MFSLLLACLFLSVGYGHAQACSEQYCLTEDYQSWLIDPNEARPLLINFKFWITDIKKVDTEKHEISLALSMEMEWTDSRVSCRNNLTETCSIPSSEVWKPDLYIMRLNKMITMEIYDEKASFLTLYNEESLISHYTEVDVMFNCHMSFASFPYDEHLCSFGISDLREDHPVEVMRLVTSNVSMKSWWKEFSPTAQDYSYQELPLDVDESTYVEEEIKDTFSVVGFKIKMIRKSTIYIYLYYLPTGFFVSISSMSFLLPPTSYPARCGLLLTTLLVLVNMFTSVLSSTPSDSSSLTALATWILACIVFVFIALLFYVIILVRMGRNSNQTCPEMENKLINLDPIFLVTHITLFTLFVLTYTFIYIFA